MEEVIIPPWCEHPDICQYTNCWEAPNGYVCSGYVKNNLENYPEEDIICVCETYFDQDKNQPASSHDVMTVNEALSLIEVLSRTIHEYNLYLKKLR